MNRHISSLWFHDLVKQGTLCHFNKRLPCCAYFARKWHDRLGRIRQWSACDWGVQKQNRAQRGFCAWLESLTSWEIVTPPTSMFAPSSVSPRRPPFSDPAHPPPWPCNRTWLGSRLRRCGVEITQEHGTLSITLCDGNKRWKQWLIAPCGIQITNLIHSLQVLLTRRPSWR